MSDSDDVTPEVTRTRVRRSRPSGRSSSRGDSRRPAASGSPGTNRPLLLVGIGLILAGLAVLSWVGWEFWGTNVVSHHRQDQVASQLQEDWGSGQDSAHTKFGEATAILHVPRFGEDYAVPVLEGDSEEVLASGIAHFPHTADAGQVGNYALAAHRVTHGEPFAKFPHLRKGDKVYVETRKATYEYQLDDNGTDLVVPMTDTWVIDRSPVNPDAGGVQPAPGSDRLITLVTCSEIFHTDNRSVVFGHLVDVVKHKGAKAGTAPQGTPDDGSGASVWWWAVPVLVLVGGAIWLLRRRTE